VETSEKVGEQRKAGERKTAGKTAHAFFVPVGFLIRFSDYLGAWNRLVPMVAIQYTEYSVNIVL